MCKYCAITEKESIFSSNFAEWNEKFVIYKTQNGKYVMGCEFELDIDDNSYPWENVIIKYCPYCGRKLGGE